VINVAAHVASLVSDLSQQDFCDCYATAVFLSYVELEEIGQRPKGSESRTRRLRYILMTCHNELAFQSCRSCVRKVELVGDS